MKRLFPLMAFILLSMPIQAQRKGVHLGPDVGVGSSIVFGDNYSYALNAKTYNYPNLYTTVGVQVTFMGNDHVGIYTGIRYTMVSFDHKFSNSSNIANMESKWGMMTIPLGVRLITSKPGKIGRAHV